MADRVKQPTFFNDSNFLIHITHIPTNKKVEFHSWLTGFTDAFSSLGKELLCMVEWTIYTLLPKLDA